MHRLQYILKEKCPNCESGNVFASKGSILRFRMPKMNDNCSVCNHKFEKEPGYFFGAMYISYGLTFIEGILIFLFSRFFTSAIFDIRLFLCIIGGIFFLSFFNFRLSRLIWMYIFTSKEIQTDSSS